MYGCESWTIRRKAGVFELWFWRRILRIPWTKRRKNKHEISLEGMIAKQALTPGGGVHGLQMDEGLPPGFGYFAHISGQPTHVYGKYAKKGTLV